MLNEQIDRMKNVLIGDTHRNNVVTVVGHTRSQGSTPQPKAPNEGDRWSGRFVSVNDNYLQDVALHIADNTSIHYFRFNSETFCNQLSVNAIYHLYHFAFIRNKQIFCLNEFGFEDIWSLPFLIIDVRHSIFCHQHTFNIGLLGNRTV